ncbi:MAG TPA: DUF2182 domain-containing protein [Acidimicrobiales bacterium]|nr:DUF2182 domain-containing protein [Acidimicrobiales bacterium]
MSKPIFGLERATRVVRPVADSPLVPAVLITLAAAGWWWSARMAGHMTGGRSMGMQMSPISLSLAAFVAAWVAMMGAMMFPAVLPVVLTYRRAALRHRVAPTAAFVLGYLIVWSAVGVPSYFAWRELQGPIAADETWAARLAGGVFIVAAAYQLSPYKSACLRHCRTPMSFFMRQRHDLRTVNGAARAGTQHGLLCLGCCWALMAVLVALGTMNIAWMVALAALIFVEKVTPQGELIARLVAMALLAFGLGFVIHPALLGRLT